MAFLKHKKCHMVSYGVKWCHMVSSAKGPRWVFDATNAEGGRCATAVAIISMFEAILFEHSTVMAGSGAFTIGADGFELGRLARCVRKDLKNHARPHLLANAPHPRARFVLPVHKGPQRHCGFAFNDADAARSGPHRAAGVRLGQLLCHDDACLLWVDGG